MEDTPAQTERQRQGQRTRERILAAAIEQLSAEGMRGLTHRKVEQRAGVAQGSAKHHFGSIDALIDAVLEVLVETDLPLVLNPQASSSPESLMREAASMLETVWSRSEFIRARYVLYLHAAGHPELQRRILAARERFIDRIAASLTGPGARRGARFIACFMDGLLLDQVSAPTPTLRDDAPALVLAAGLAGQRLAAATNADAET